MYHNHDQVKIYNMWGPSHCPHVYSSERPCNIYNWNTRPYDSYYKKFPTYSYHALPYYPMYRNDEFNDKYFHELTRFSLYNDKNGDRLLKSQKVGSNDYCIVKLKSHEGSIGSELSPKYAPKLATIRKCRKNPYPSKSPSKSDLDPRRGLIFKLKLKLIQKKSTIDTLLEFDISYSRLKERVKISNLNEFENESDSDDSQPQSLNESRVDKTINKKKHCESCKAFNTPLWRDTLEGISLCNACGIRYRKYKFMCNTCHYVPTKYEKERITCSSCETGIFSDKLED